MTAKFSKAALRGLRVDQRMEAMRSTTPGVSVLPANEDGRRLLKHPNGGGFPADGAAVWPDDRFTKRRLADGSVTREAPPEPPPEGRQQERREPDQRRQDEPNDAA